MTDDTIATSTDTPPNDTAPSDTAPNGTAPSDTAAAGAAASAGELSPAELDHSTVGVVDEPHADDLAARAPVTPDSPAFADFAVKPEIVRALADVGITHTFAIQELTLPIALEGKDLIGQARTGMGKTLGFGVPLLNQLELPGGDGAMPQALVVAPTRELAVQVSADLAAAGKHLGARVLTIYGGRAYEPQTDALRKGVDVVVGTPGRLLDLAQQGHLKLHEARILVLDEADEMLDLGFLPDIEKLLAMVPAARQTMLFSATMPGPIVALARQFLIQPIQIRAEQGSARPNVSHIDQFAYRAHAMDKAELLSRILQARNRELALIFTRTKRTADKVATDLVDRGFAAGAIHGDLGQGAREQALRAFRAGKIDVLVATDVAARGLDVDGISHVVNYQAPEDTMTYVHRIGRTARAGKKGTAVTFVDWDDVPRWKLICTELDLPFHEPVETYSTSPHVYLELDIPENTKGTLPRSSRTREGLGAEVLEDLGGRDSTKGGTRGTGRGDARARSGARGTRPGGSAGRSGERTDGAAPERGERPARTRNRTRTRSGNPVGSDPAAGATSDAPAAAGNAATREPSTGRDGHPESGSDTGTTRPRRRRRGGRGRGTNGDSGGNNNSDSNGSNGPAHQHTDGQASSGASDQN